MACNCNVNKELNKFLNAIGEVPNDGTPKERIKTFLIKTSASFIMILTIPLIILYTANKVRNGDNKISFADFFGLREMSYNTNVG